MAVKVKIVQHDEYLEVIVSGQRDNIDLIDKFPQLMETCNLTGLSKVIIDYRELQGEQSVTEKREYAFGIEKHYTDHISSGGQPIQFAYVGESVSDEYNPGIELAQNNGLPFALFEQIDEALEWLGLKPT